MFHPHAFLCRTPPLSLRQKACGPQRHEKTPRIWPLKPALQTGLPGTSNSRQSRPLPLASLRAVWGTWENKSCSVNETAYCPSKIDPKNPRLEH